MGAASSTAKALSLTDDQVRAYAAQMVEKMDKEARVAPASNKYAARLMALTSSAREDKGLPLNYKAYLSNEGNAFACADGSIRFYSGLMDIMTDDEIRYVIGHEMGHVSAAHTKCVFR
jgi:putative metalloprotease